MKCPNCKKELKKVEVEGVESKAISHQCDDCGFAEFEKESAAKVLKELKLKESPLKYFNKM